MRGSYRIRVVHTEAAARFGFTGLSGSADEETNPGWYDEDEAVEAEIQAELSAIDSRARSASAGVVNATNDQLEAELGRIEATW